MTVFGLVHAIGGDRFSPLLRRSSPRYDPSTAMGTGASVDGRWNNVVRAAGDAFSPAGMFHHTRDPEGLL